MEGLARATREMGLFGKGDPGVGFADPGALRCVHPLKLPPGHTHGASDGHVTHDVDATDFLLELVAFFVAVEDPGDGGVSPVYDGGFGAGPGAATDEEIPTGASGVGELKVPEVRGVGVDGGAPAREPELVHQPRKVLELVEDGGDILVLGAPDLMEEV